MGPDIEQTTITADDVSAIDWVQAERNAQKAAELAFADEIDYDVDPEGYKQQWQAQTALAYVEDGDFLGATGQEIQELIAHLPGQEAFAALLRADITRLRTWMEQGPQGEMHSEYASGGSVRHVGRGAVVSGYADLRHWVAGLDEPYFTIDRLVNLGIIHDVTGLKVDYI
jgi:hypothetical protein